MVQIQKKEVQENILKIAREEFFVNGFANASLREISKKSGCALSNIYNYFDNKDDIFASIVLPTTEVLNSFIKRLKKAEPSYLKFDKSEAYFTEIIDFFAKHKDNLKLIAFRSKGSNFENYVEDWIFAYAKFENESLRKKAKSHKEIFRKLPSEFFIKSLCLYFFKSTLELLNKDLTEEKFSKHLDEIFGFVYNGWNYYLD
jgi:AcrR family transcriptional regulator